MISALVTTPGPQMDPEKPGVGHLVDVARYFRPGVTGTPAFDQGDPRHGDLGAQICLLVEGIGELGDEGPACGVEAKELPAS